MANELAEIVNTKVNEVVGQATEIAAIGALNHGNGFIAGLNRALTMAGELIHDIDDTIGRRSPAQREQEELNEDET